MGHPLYIAFVWHHHQPYYREPGRETYALPWVRVHAAKDYLFMAELLAEYPEVKATFNFVPSLLEQLDAYARGRAEDPMTLLGRQASWSEEEKQLILNLGFSINWQHLAFLYPRYRELIQRRDTVLRDPQVFGEQDYRDLIALFNLAWTHPRYVREDARLRALAEKGRDFTPEDIETIVAVHRELCARVIPAYRELEEKGQVELILSPYYHPILPLLVNTDHARRATPDIQVPHPPFHFPEDAETQVREGMAFYKDVFGHAPTGMWPSEQAVSPETVEILRRAGIRWFISDEAILGRSLDYYFARDEQEQVYEPHRLYRPYRVPTAAGEIVGVFRDHTLSDKVGFVYMHYPPQQAAEDLIVRLQTIYYRLNAPDTPRLVVIALDGENPWEHYEGNGEPFLRDVYRRLAAHPHLKTVTVSEFLDRFPVDARLDRLATGSWINGDLTTWIGDPEHTRAWSVLRDARQAWEERARLWQNNHEREDTLRRALRHLHIAEASDWFWWYSRRNTSDQDVLFDALFRANVAAAYQTLGLPVPFAVTTPIVGRPAAEVEQLPPPLITPPLDASPDPTPHWARAHVLRPRTSVGTMQTAQAPIQAVRVGYDARNVYVRLELGQHVPGEIVVSLTGPSGELGDVLIPPCDHGRPVMWRYGHRVDVPMRFRCRRRVVELAIPRQVLGVYPGDEVGIRVGIFRDGVLDHALPPDTPYRLRV